MTLNLFSSSLCRWHNQLFQLFLLWKYGPLLKRSLYIPYFIHSSPNIFPVATLLHVLGYLCVKIPDYWLQYSCVVVLKENVQLTGCLEIASFLQTLLTCWKNQHTISVCLRWQFGWFAFFSVKWFVPGNFISTLKLHFFRFLFCEQNCCLFWMLMHKIRRYKVLTFRISYVIKMPPECFIQTFK